MTWEIASVFAVLSVPIVTTFVVNKTLTDDKNELFYWLRLFVFFINLALIGVGLWVGQTIAALNNSTVADLLEVAWTAYTWSMVIIFILVLLLLTWQFGKALFDKFPSLTEKR